MRKRRAIGLEGLLNGFSMSLALGSRDMIGFIETFWMETGTLPAVFSRRRAPEPPFSLDREFP
jgi:hypothetical protein